jgi:hypothetical protein
MGVYVGLVAEFELIVDGETVFWEEHWPVVEMYEYVVSWRLKQYRGQLGYEPTDAYDDPPDIREIAGNRYEIVTGSGSNASISRAELSAGLAEFERAVERSFADVTGKTLSEWRTGTST